MIDALIERPKVWTVFVAARYIEGVMQEEFDKSVQSLDLPLMVSLEDHEIALRTLRDQLGELQTRCLEKDEQKRIQRAEITTLTSERDAFEGLCRQYEKTNPDILQERDRYKAALEGNTAFVVGFMYEWACAVEDDHDSPAGFSIPALIDAATVAQEALEPTKEKS